MTHGASERRILLLLAAVMFVNVLDFMMVMPLGPDFAVALAIPLPRLGLVGGSYTVAAAIAGMLGMLVLDRFDRRKALAVALFGLVCGTVAGGFATGLGTMLAARVLAGAFGGPAAALSLAIIADVVPPERRGRAMGVVMGAFSAASVLGVPAGLELARLGGWRVPFFAVAGVGVLLAVLAIALLPPLTGHMAAASAPTSGFGAFMRRPAVLLSLLATALVMIGNFLLIPNLAAYWMFNYGYPRERLGLLYLVGGIVSFITMPVAGRLVDRFGSTSIAAIGTLLVLLVTFPVFIYPVYWLPVLLVFATFMGFASFRMIPMQTLGTRVPHADERARFMSANSAVQHMGAAIGAIAGAQMLSEAPGGALVGMHVVGWLSVLLAAPLPLLLWAVERRLRPHGEATSPLSPTGPAIRQA
jgi:predicted MFS family arabinose efflux permease